MDIKVGDIVEYKGVKQRVMGIHQMNLLNYQKSIDAIGMMLKM